MVTLQPQLTVPSGFPPGPVELFALISLEGKWYIAAQDAFCPDVPTLLEYRSGDRILSYGMMDTFEGKNSYTFDIFVDEKINCSWAKTVSELATKNAHFYVGYAPKGDMDKGNYTHLHYTDISFSPDLQ
jgi:hypothetical protein